MTDQVPEADALEQQQEVIPEDHDVPGTTPDEADPADAVDQAKTVPDEDEDGYDAG